MKPHPFRAKLLTTVLLCLVVAGWVFLAPTQVGGSTTYVVTHGISMEPRFHTGDLALVRPASQYRVGQVVAYHSSLLHVVVLHRIIAIHDGHYVFKGDNNNFVDPVHPTRALLVGALWLRLPHGGVLIDLLHSPAIAALLLGAVGALVLLGNDQARRRRRRRDPSKRDPRPMTPAPTPPLNLRTAMVGAALVSAAFVVLCAFALLTPTTAPTSRRIPYQQQGSFSYRAAAPPSTVYPSGVVSTGEPLFTSIIHHLHVALRYRFDSSALHAVRGSERVTVKLTGPTGWSRVISSAPVRPFTGDRFTAGTTLDLPTVEALLAQVQQLTGIPTSGAAVQVSASIRVHGILAGQALAAHFTPSLSFQLEPLQLQPDAGAGTVSQAAPSGSGGATQSGFSPSAGGTVITTSPGPNSIGPFGVAVPVTTLRTLALVGLALSVLATVILAILMRRSGPFDEAAKIQARYGHMLVPIVAGEDLGWPPVDVSGFKSLVRLAEAAGLMILHHHGEESDTYLVNDDGTVYRYQAQLPKVIWGEWSEPPVKLVA